MHLDFYSSTFSLSNSCLLRENYCIFGSVITVILVAIKLLVLTLKVEECKTHVELSIIMNRIT